MVALRTPGLRQLAFDEELLALRLLTDRRDELAKLRVQAVNRLHRLLTELMPAGRTAGPVRAAGQETGGEGEAQIPAGEDDSTDGRRGDRRPGRRGRQAEGAQEGTKAVVLARGSHLMDLFGVGPAVAARVLADVGDVAVPRPQPLRVLDRDRTPGRLVW